MRVLLAVVLAVFCSAALSATNTLEWDYPAAEEPRVTTFNLERKAEACAGAGAFAEIATVGATSRIYADNTVAEGTTYCYQVRAVGPGGVSPYSNQVARTVPFTAPAAPTNLRVSGGP